MFYHDFAGFLLLSLRFKNLDDFGLMDQFDVSRWGNLNEDINYTEITKIDMEKLNKLAILLKTPLEFDIKEAKKKM